MNKEYTGEEFEIEFARAWLKYVEGGKVGVDPRTQWEVLELDCYGWESRNAIPSCLAGRRYRWKPIPKRMVTISYKTDKMAMPVAKELVLPEVEPPPDGTVCFWLGGNSYKWSNSGADMSALRNGLIFLTAEDSDAMADWLAVCRKGGQA